MSGNSGERATRGIPRRPDRRVLRTRDILGDALVDLMQERPFDDITVQELLDRAGVGRSTFYSHYRDKNDLFVSDVEDFFSMLAGALTRKGADPRRLAPVAELFAHVGEMHEFYRSVAGAGKVADVQSLGRAFFARSIEGRFRAAGATRDRTALQAESHALAAAMFALLEWWLDHDMRPTAQVMDELFHRMAWSGSGQKGEP